MEMCDIKSTRILLSYKIVIILSPTCFVNLDKLIGLGRMQNISYYKKLNLVKTSGFVKSAVYSQVFQMCSYLV